MSHCVRILLLQGVLQAGRTRRRVRREAVWYLPRDRSGATARLTGDRDAVGDAAGQRLVGELAGAEKEVSGKSGAYLTTAHLCHQRFLLHSLDILFMLHG
jgi:hypothetical protein